MALRSISDDSPKIAFPPISLKSPLSSFYLSEIIGIFSNELMIVIFLKFICETFFFAIGLIERSGLIEGDGKALEFDYGVNDLSDIL